MAKKGQKNRFSIPGSRNRLSPSYRGRHTFGRSCVKSAPVAIVTGRVILAAPAVE